MCGEPISSKFVKRKSITCGPICKNIQIGKSKTENTPEISEKTIPHTTEYINNYWHNNRKLPDHPFYESVKGKHILSNNILLRKINVGAKEHYSTEYKLWFYLNSINTLKIFLDNKKITYFDYHKNNNLGLISSCSECDKDILQEDVFGIRYKNKFCSSDCYLQFAKSGKREERMHSEESKRKQSVLLKNKIKSGDWTPNVHNSRTHFSAESVINGVVKKYRSSWEAAYATIYPKAEFEKIRIPYMYLDKYHIYIVDFLKEDTKELIEIKPTSHLSNPKYIKKREAALQFCQDQGYTFIEHDEKYFLHLLQEDGIMSLLEGSLSPETFNSLLKGIHYENYVREIN